MFFCMIYNSDEDECRTDNGGCSDICHNTEGHFFCSCYQGFTLEGDDQTCEGMINFSMSLFLFLTLAGVRLNAQENA